MFEESSSFVNAPESLNQAISGVMPEETRFQADITPLEEGDILSWADLISQRRPDLVLYSGSVARRLGSLVEGEDAAQEAFIRFYLKVREGGFDSSIPNWDKIYLKKIVFNFLIDAKRSDSRHVDEELTDSFEDATIVNSVTPEREVLAKLELKHAIDDLKTLPKDQMEALAGLSLFGNTVKEMANDQGVDQDVIKSRTHRARQKMRQLALTS